MRLKVEIRMVIKARWTLTFDLISIMSSLDATMATSIFDLLNKIRSTGDQSIPALGGDDFIEVMGNIVTSLPLQGS